MSVAVACSSHDLLFLLQTEVMADPVAYVLEVDSVAITRVFVSEKGGEGEEEVCDVCLLERRSDGAGKEPDQNRAWTVEVAERTGVEGFGVDMYSSNIL